MTPEHKPRTGSAMLTFEQAIDIGIFDGRVMSGSTATRPAPAAERAPRPVAPSIDPEQPTGVRTHVLIAIAGVVLLVAGIAALSYVGFETIGTDRIAAANQAQLGARFEERILAGPPTEPAPTVATTVPVDAADFEDGNDVPVFLGPIEEPTRPPAEVPAGWVTELPPALGEPTGRIVIPKIDVDWLMVEGVGVPQLKQGPGHMTGTPMPGQLGNSVISGHRTTYGAPFNRLDQLVAGDRFIVQTVAGTNTYEVVDVQVVAPRDLWVTTQFTGSWLTLTTCNPKGSSRQRLVVFSKLVAGPNAGIIAARFPASYDPPTPPS